LDNKEEAFRLIGEAKEDLGRALRNIGIRDWVTVVHYAQLAIEKSAKAVISCFEAFKWTHDPSDQLLKIIERGLLEKSFMEICSHVKEAAPWHGRATYGGIRNGKWKSPSQLCNERIAHELLDRANRCTDMADRFIEGFFEG